MKWPKTVRGWLELTVAAFALLGMAAGGVWRFHESNAYASDVQAVEEKVMKGLDAFIEEQESDRCSAWLYEITLLEDREASGNLTDGQRTRLIVIRNQYEAKCGNGDG